MEDGILLARVSLRVEGRDRSADVKTAQSCAVEIVTVLIVVRRHQKTSLGMFG